jgi:23S rRNA (cytidine1920-2'-O)/16S rRNA (cytidine1409-2'-O)-methyltransferase
VTKRRLDTELVRRGLVASRAEAHEAVRAGLVTVGGSPATKVATLVGADQPVDLRGTTRRFVSRGGEKLQAALDRFALDPSGARCLDAGASTGGFTDCLLRAGAAGVIAVDVGYGQLAWSLRSDERVTVLERVNVRDLTPADLPFTPGFVVADLSFISLGTVSPRLVEIADDAATFVALVKPQFEAGPADVARGGVVREPSVWARVLGEVADVWQALGVGVQGAMASPITGRAGNVEFLIHGVAGAPGVTLDLERLCRDGEDVRG